MFSNKYAFAKHAHLIEKFEESVKEVERLWRSLDILLQKKLSIYTTKKKKYAYGREIML